ncbi:NTP transferase domain-containing protein [Microbispora hainanensis]|uniref:cytidylyltransferase domain-containing protein n=1 Tax=Microbispora hainanensis TaxID=568844 RepID=UPI0033DA252E
MTAAPTAQPRPERRHIAIIPCRWGASCFPCKPLAPLGDKPLLWHVHKRCMEATRLDGVLVATDDERIETVCRELGIECMRTREHSPAPTASRSALNAFPWTSTSTSKATSRSSRRPRSTPSPTLSTTSPAAHSR